MYLFTPDQMHLYASLGWDEMRTVIHRGELETIMRIRPEARRAAIAGAGVSGADESESR